MRGWPPAGLYTRSRFKAKAKDLLQTLKKGRSLADSRQRLHMWICRQELGTKAYQSGRLSEKLILMRDCARAMRGMINPYAEERAGFSVTQALWDLARDRRRKDLKAGFFAEMIHMIQGIQGRAGFESFKASNNSSLKLSDRQASKHRSDELDSLWNAAEAKMSGYLHGLAEEAVERRKVRKAQVLEALGGKPQDWLDWTWQVKHIATEADGMAKLVRLGPEEIEAIRRARQCQLPFGVTPYYASLMDEQASTRDRAIRAQVLPPLSYVESMEKNWDERKSAFDFMGEHETSPVDLITRRYPAVLILKPFNTCPQICVYCQRNWEIDQAMAPGALAPFEKIEAAIRWIERHPAIREVLVTGGDPLILEDEGIERILSRLARVASLDVIRIGSRIPVTLPMRISHELASVLGKFREPGRREICLVTHIQHPYEITPEMLVALDRLKRQGISIFNQQVYTFFVSRRFETAKLRMLLRTAGVDPYYTFVAKGKEETRVYRVPVARLLQEQKEEARLLPGIRRTDEVVYNVPKLGKNHIRAYQHRDLLSVLPTGERVYEFHPWEKHLVQRDSYVGSDVSVLDYLSRLADIGEDPKDYESIWYYY